MDDDIVITISRAALSEVLGDAIAFRTNSGEGADSDEDEETAERYRALAARHGLEPA